jgi:hypothetical protein
VDARLYAAGNETGGFGSNSQACGIPSPTRKEQFMKATSRTSSPIGSVIVLLTMVMLVSGCATSGRYVLLKEYGASVPAAPDQPLKGTTICIKGFQCAPNLTEPDPATRPEQPERFSYVRFTGDQSQTWSREFKAMKKSTSKADWRQIGNVRNGFGIVMSHVYALNDPGAWLAQTLKMDWESQGARVVDASQADTADICVSGTVRFCRVDIYMKIWGDLVVDMEFQPKSRAASRTQLHTEGGTVAVFGATSEFYTPLREGRQKLSWLATRELMKALKP